MVVQDHHQKSSHHKFTRMESLSHTPQESASLLPGVNADLAGMVVRSNLRTNQHGVSSQKSCFFSLVCDVALPPCAPDSDTRPKVGKQKLQQSRHHIPTQKQLSRSPRQLELHNRLTKCQPVQFPRSTLRTDRKRERMAPRYQRLLK